MLAIAENSDDSHGQLLISTQTVAEYQSMSSLQYNLDKRFDVALYPSREVLGTSFRNSRIAKHAFSEMGKIHYWAV